MGTSSGHTRVLDLRARQVAAEWSVNNKEEVPIRTLCVDDDPNKVHVAFGNGHLQVCHLTQSSIFHHSNLIFNAAF
jgi:hypothetical protein